MVAGSQVSPFQAVDFLPEVEESEVAWDVRAGADAAGAAEGQERDHSCVLSAVCQTAHSDCCAVAEQVAAAARQEIADQGEEALALADAGDAGTSATALEVQTYAAKACHLPSADWEVAHTHSRADRAMEAVAARSGALDLVMHEEDSRSCCVVRVVAEAEDLHVVVDVGQDGGNRSAVRKDAARKLGVGAASRQVKDRSEVADHIHSSSAADASAEELAWVGVVVDPTPRTAAQWFVLQEPLQHAWETRPCGLWDLPAVGSGPASS